MVDKPGRRKKNAPPWGKISAAVVIGIILVAIGYYVYETYIYKAPPVYARIDTTFGAIYVELFPACAPQTVANFVSLSRSGFYNGLVWHRLVPGFVIQTGDPNSRGGLNSTRNSWGRGGSNSSIAFEWCGWLHNYAGYLAMASTSPGKPGTSQFFINLSNSTSNLGLDGNYSVFGKVISGMNVVSALAKSPRCLPPGCNSAWQDQPVPPVFMNDVVILTAPPTVTTVSSSTTS